MRLDLSHLHDLLDRSVVVDGIVVPADHREAMPELRTPTPGEITSGSIVRLKISKRGFAYAGETATVEEVDRDRDAFVVAFDRIRTLRLYGSDEGSAWERF